MKYLLPILLLLACAAVANAQDDDPALLLEQAKRCLEGTETDEAVCSQFIQRRVEDAAKIVPDIAPPMMPVADPDDEGPGALGQLEGSGFSVWVAESRAGTATMLALHTVGLATVIGLWLFINLRLLNVIGGFPIHALLGPMQLAWFGFALNALSGVAMFASQATIMAGNKPFLVKIGFVLLGGLLAWHLQRETRSNAAKWQDNAVPASIRAGAAASLLCWTGVIVAGRLIAWL